MVSQRKCCVRECKNDYLTHTLFTFPKIDWSLFKGDNPLLFKALRRSLHWIQKSGNLSLLKEYPHNLHCRYFMCSGHFDTIYFAGRAARKLKSNALPHLFPHNGISDMDMNNYIACISKHDKSDLLPSLKLSSGNHPRDSQSQKAEVKKKRRAIRKCKVLLCGSTDLSSTIFAFPRPSYMSFHGAPINANNYIRCKLWLQAAGNISLLAVSPLNLWRHAFICTVHFEAEHFHSKMKRKLLPTAVPTKLLPAPLSDDKMREYNSLFSEVDEMLNLINEESLCIATSSPVATPHSES